MLQPKSFAAKNSGEHTEPRGVQGRATPLAHTSMRQRGCVRETRREVEMQGSPDGFCLQRGDPESWNHPGQGRSQVLGASRSLGTELLRLYHVKSPERGFPGLTFLRTVVPTVPAHQGHQVKLTSSVVPQMRTVRPIKLPPLSIPNPKIQA